jgi:hypothetical protein
MHSCCSLFYQITSFFQSRKAMQSNIQILEFQEKSWKKEEDFIFMKKTRMMFILSERIHFYRPTIFYFWPVAFPLSALSFSSDFSHPNHRQVHSGSRTPTKRSKIFIFAKGNLVSRLQVRVGNFAREVEEVENVAFIAIYLESSEFGRNL